MQGIIDQIKELFRRLEILERSSGKSSTQADFEVTDPDKGVVMTDRTTSTKYRIYIDNGVIEIETV